MVALLVAAGAWLGCQAARDASYDIDRSLHRTGRDVQNGLYSRDVDDAQGDGGAAPARQQPARTDAVPATKPTADAGSAPISL
jgi:hypothetical protein